MIKLGIDKRLFIIIVVLFFTACNHQRKIEPQIKMEIVGIENFDNNFPTVSKVSLKITNNYFMPLLVRYAEDRELSYSKVWLKHKGMRYEELHDRFNIKSYDKRLENNESIQVLFTTTIKFSELDSIEFQAGIFDTSYQPINKTVLIFKTDSLHFDIKYE